MSQGQGNHGCLFRSQWEWWLAAQRQRANSVVWLPCSRICLALKAGSPILLVNLEGLRAQGWQIHASLIRNWGLNQNVNLLFSNKSCTSQVCSDLPTEALPFLVCLSVAEPEDSGAVGPGVWRPCWEVAKDLNVLGAFQPCAQRSHRD